ncbi:hypothetical protein MCAV_02240 [[Mycoplasma] cavipharyngis]|uniref:hypothetical protein n=1 Tax=[Mycoplasma] cavipharyngis TaxID=92757 RepID=UPI003703DB7C
MTNILNNIFAEAPDINKTIESTVSSFWSQARPFIWGIGVSLTIALAIISCLVLFFKAKMAATGDEQIAAQNRLKKGILYISISVVAIFILLGVLDGVMSRFDGGSKSNTSLLINNLTSEFVFKYPRFNFLTI